MKGLNQETIGSILASEHEFTEFRTRMHAVAELVGNPTNLARLAGISATGIRHYFSDGEPTRDKLVRLANAGGVRIEWFVDGQGPMRDFPRSVRVSMAQEYERYLLAHELDDDNGSRSAFAAAYNTGLVPLRLPEVERVAAYELRYWYAEYQAAPGETESFLPVPFYELEKLDAWPPQRGVRPIMVMGFTRELVEGGMGVNIARFAGFRVEDDSLHPTIRPGDFIIADTGGQEAVRNGIFVVSLLGGPLMVRRLQQVETTKLSILRDRRSYRDVMLVDYPLKPDGSKSDMQIIGRVVWLSGRKIRV